MAVHSTGEKWFEDVELEAPARVSRKRGLEAQFKEAGSRAGHLLINYAPTDSRNKSLVGQAQCAHCRRWFSHGKKIEEFIGNCGDAVPSRRGQ